LKARVLLKALWLLTFLFFSILLSVQISERGAIILPLFRSTRNANLGAEELDRNYTSIQTKESGLRDAVLTSPMELLEKEYALTMSILLFGTRRDSRQNSQNVLSSPRLRRVIDRMHAGFSSEIDLKTLAIERGYSCNHFLEMFREATGHSPHQYRLRLRVTGPQELMNNRSIALLDIVPECEFASHSHLSDVFRQTVRAPPGDFRRETPGHSRASLVVSGKRALGIWTIESP
jgi:AraC-like DNA-binding protein